MKVKTRMAGQGRHILTALGVYLVASGRADEATVEQIIGGLVALASLLASWFAPEKRAAPRRE